MTLSDTLLKCENGSAVRTVGPLLVLGLPCPTLSLTEACCPVGKGKQLFLRSFFKGGGKGQEI